jgi:hypothetical protein
VRGAVGSNPTLWLAQVTQSQRENPDPRDAHQEQADRTDGEEEQGSPIQAITINRWRLKPSSEYNMLPHTRFSNTRLTDFLQESVLEPRSTKTQSAIVNSSRFHAKVSPIGSQVFGTD